MDIDELQDDINCFARCREKKLTEQSLMDSINQLDVKEQEQLGVDLIFDLYSEFFGDFADRNVLGLRTKYVMLLSAGVDFKRVKHKVQEEYFDDFGNQNSGDAAFSHNYDKIIVPLLKKWSGEYMKKLSVVIGDSANINNDVSRLISSYAMMGMRSRNKSSMPCNRPTKSWRPGKKRVVKACSGGREKIIHFGASGYGHNYSPTARRSFRARHRCSTAKDKLTARHWACKNLWTKGGSSKKPPARRSRRRSPTKKKRSRRRSPTKKKRSRRRSPTKKKRSRRRSPTKKKRSRR